MRPRFLIWLTVALLLVLGFTGVASAALTDLGPGTLYRDAIEDLAARQIISGFPDGTFRPQDPVARQQFAKMIVGTAGYPVSESDICPFADVETGGATTLYPDNYVAVCAAKSITAGKTPTTFDPTGRISRHQVVSMAVRTADDLRLGLLTAPPTGWTPAGSPGADAWTADPTHGANIARAGYHGLLDGLDLSFLDPAGNATRGEVAQILFNLIGLLEAPAEEAAWSVEQVGCSWWCMPRAVYQSSDSRLYLTGVSPQGKAVIAAITPATGAVERVELASLGRDEHNTPSLLVPDDLPPIVVYTNHNTDAVVRIRRGQTVNDISAFLPEQTLVSTTGTTTYAQLFREPGTRDLLVLTRTGSTKWCFSRSTDYGETWSALSPLFSFGSGNQGYLVTRQVGADLHCALYGHPTSSRIHEVYFCIIELDTGAVKRKDGTTVANVLAPAGLPVDVVTSLTLAYDPPAGHNIRLFDISPTDEIAVCEWTTDDDATYKYLRWNGAGWTRHDMTATGVVLGYTPAIHYHGGASFPDPGAGVAGDNRGGVLYLSRELGGVWFIEKWSTSDHGLTWLVKEICRSDTVKLVRPYCPLNGSGVVFTRLYSYAGYRSFDADMVWRP